MRFATIALALLSLASLLAAAVLSMSGRIGECSVAAGWFVAGFCAMFAAEHGGDQLRQWTDELRATRARFWFWALAVASSVLPLVVLVAFDGSILAVLFRQLSSDRPWTAWLLTYGVASGPATLFAAITRLQERTLCGIHAYTGHLVYLTMSVLWFGCEASWAVLTAVATVLLLAPVILGTLVAASGRSMMRSLHA